MRNFKKGPGTLVIVRLVITIMFVSLLASNAMAFKFQHIVSFGDSLTDHNGLIRYVPTVPEAWTNGDVWVEYLARDFQISPENLENYAIGGAMTRNHKSDQIQAMIPNLGFIGQVNTYLASNPEFEPSKTLFTVLIGGNNFFKWFQEEYILLSTVDEINKSVEEMISKAINDIEEGIKSLVDKNAMHILVVNLPDLGNTPYLNHYPNFNNQFSQFVDSFNQSLFETVNELDSGYTETEFYTFDVFTYMNELIESGLFPDTTGTYMILNDVLDPTTENYGEPEKYLFWDSVHPMTKAHELIAKDLGSHLEKDNTYTYEDVQAAIDNALKQWDIKNDKKIGLEEAIHALKVSSKMPQ